MVEINAEGEYPYWTWLHFLVNRSIQPPWSHVKAAQKMRYVSYKLDLYWNAFGSKMLNIGNIWWSFDFSLISCYFSLQDVICHEWLNQTKKEIPIGADPEDLDEDVIGAVTFHQCCSVVSFAPLFMLQWRCSCFKKDCFSSSYYGCRYGLCPRRSTNL